MAERDNLPRTTPDTDDEKRQIDGVHDSGQPSSTHDREGPPLRFEGTFVSFSGPLPPDEYLARLKSIGGDQLMLTAVQMSERAQEHAHKVQLLEIENARLYDKEEADLRHEAIELSDHVDRRETVLAAFGILSALVLGLSVIGLGVYLAAFHGLEVGGSILGAGGLASLVYVFVYGSRKQRDNVQTFTLDSVDQGAEVEDRAQTKDANAPKGSPDL